MQIRKTEQLKRYVIMKMKKALILALLTVLTATGYAQTTKFAMTIGTDL